MNSMKPNASSLLKGDIFSQKFVPLFVSKRSSPSSVTESYFDITFSFATALCPQQKDNPLHFW